jgi:hypothetical protein
MSLLRIRCAFFGDSVNYGKPKKRTQHTEQQQKISKPFSKKTNPPTAINRPLPWHRQVSPLPFAARNSATPAASSSICPSSSVLKASFAGSIV